jgi:hypothetical protein
VEAAAVAVAAVVVVVVVAHTETCHSFNYSLINVLPTFILARLCKFGFYFLAEHGVA